MKVLQMLPRTKLAVSWNLKEDIELLSCSLNFHRSPLTTLPLQLNLLKRPLVLQPMEVHGVCPRQDWRAKS